MLWHVGHAFLSITFITRSHPAHHFFYPNRPPWTKPKNSMQPRGTSLGAQAWSNGALQITTISSLSSLDSQEEEE